MSRTTAVLGITGLIVLVTAIGTQSWPMVVAASVAGLALTAAVSAVVVRHRTVSAVTAVLAGTVATATAVASRSVVLTVLAAVAAAIIVVGLWWAFRPQHHLAHNRVRLLRTRLHLHLYAGRGLASTWEVWRRWGRLASYRESKRTRPGLTRRHRLCHAATHCILIGCVQYNMRVRVPIQEHVAVLGPPRGGKTALFAHAIDTAPGVVVCTSSKPDLYEYTSGVRARRGKIYVFNPMAIGDIPSNVVWNPLDGCLNPSTAIRRADALTDAVSVAGTEDGTFWTGKASDGMRAILAAAAIASGADMQTVSLWAGSEREVGDAVRILAAYGHEGWANQLAELTGPAEKTAATVRMVMSRALAFLNDPVLAAAVTPVPGQESFDIDKFLIEGGTLYMMARGAAANALAPLFAALAAEIEHRAVELGSRMPKRRLDPPLHMFLDEVTQICPVPLPQWLADAGGQGVQIWTAFHGRAQLESRWGHSNAKTIWNTSNVKILMPGIAEEDTLETASRLSDKVSFRMPGREDDSFQFFEILTPGMIRQLPDGHGLVLRNNCAPLIAKTVRGWKHRGYRQLDRHGKAIAPVEPARALTTTPPALPPAANPQPALPAAPPAREVYPWSPPGMEPAKVIEPAEMANAISGEER